MKGGSSERILRHELNDQSLAIITVICSRSVIELPAGPLAACPLAQQMMTFQGHAVSSDGCFR